MMLFAWLLCIVGVIFAVVAPFRSAKQGVMQSVAGLVLLLVGLSMLL